jgi:opacity protein-like surface antigen
MKATQLALVGSLLLAATYASAARTDHTVRDNAHPARPGSVNYVEGTAALDGETLKTNAVGSVEMGKDQVLTTEGGKVEVLLTPGVFLRVGDNSSLKMLSPELANTIVELDKGQAFVEVLDISKENNIRVNQNDASTKLVNKGLYNFDADHNDIRVFKGKAEVYAGTQKITLTQGRDLALTGRPRLNARYFDSRQYANDLYRWSGLRSGYLSEASVDAARVYVGIGSTWYGPDWYGPGWYWDPWFMAYTFLPARGVFYSPFGWGFYSPIFVYGSPYFYFGYYHYPHRFLDFHEPYGHGFGPSGDFRGGVVPHPGPRTIPGHAR